MLQDLGLHLDTARQQVEAHLNSAGETLSETKGATSRETEVEPPADDPEDEPLSVLRERLLESLLAEKEARIQELERELRHWRTLGVRLEQLGQLAAEVGALNPDPEAAPTDAPPDNPPVAESPDAVPE